MITYNVPAQTVKYATYVSSSGSTGTSDITDGLVAWWKLNGDANTAVGTANGTLLGPTSRVGQNNTANNAYSFNGSGQYVRFDQAVVPAGSSNFSISLWVNRSRNNGSYEELMSQWTNAASGNSFYLGFLNSSVRFSDSWSTITASGASTVGSWFHLVAVNDASANNAYIYINGTVVATKGSRLSYTGAGNLNFGNQGEYAGGAEWFSGSMDDIRLYNRALLPAEIASLYSAGAK